MVGATGFLEAGELAAGLVAEALEDVAHAGELVLEGGAGGVVGAGVEERVDLALEGRRLLRRVLAQGLGHELDVQRRLHQGREVVALALLPECFQ